MAGHSKWANIKHRKGAQDAKRGKIFTRVIKEITIAVKEGGGPDPDTNPRLRLAIANGKGVNMPKDTIQRAIDKAAGAGADTYVETTFEGYASGGVAVFVEASTDNNQRTVSNVRSIFSKHGGSLGTNGSLAFIFNRQGMFTIDKAAIGDMDAEEFEMELIDGGAEEVEAVEDAFLVTTSFEDFGAMQSKLEELSIEPKSAELIRTPTTTQELSLEDAKKVLKLVEKMEEDDDVNQVFHNLELTDEVLAALEEE